MSRLSEYLLNQIFNALEYLPHISPDSDIEVLHQFRVNLRRAISLLKLYRPDSPELIYLKKIHKTTNELRELDVLLESINAMLHHELYHIIKRYRERLFNMTITDEWLEKSGEQLVNFSKQFSVQDVNETADHLQNVALKFYDDTIVEFEHISPEASNEAGKFQGTKA